MRSSRFVVLLAAVLVTCGVLAGCSKGGNTTTGPGNVPTPVAATIAVTSSASGPVSGAVVNIGGNVKPTDAAGRASFDAVLPNTPVDITATGFLGPRLDVVPANFGGGMFPVTLCQLRPEIGFDESYILAAVYGGSPSYPNTRVIHDTDFSIGPSLASDPEVVATFTAAAALLTRANGRYAVRAVVPPATSGGVVTVFNVDLRATGGTYDMRYGKSGDVITGGTVTFYDVKYAKNVSYVAHMMADAMGASPNSAPGGGLLHISLFHQYSDFTPREVLALQFKFMRDAGNQYPDRAPGR